MTHDNGTKEYLVKFKGLDEPEWIASKDMTGCKKLLREYEAAESIRELGRGANTSKQIGGMACAVELNMHQGLSGPNRGDVLKAVVREEKQMLARRLRPVDEAEANDLTAEQKKRAYRLRHLLTKKRPTVEQQQEGKVEGEYKDRIVCMDVKGVHVNKAAAEDVHMGVPEKEVLRVIAAAADLSKETMTTGD